MNVYILKSSCGKFIKIGKANDVSIRVKQIGEDRFNLYESFYARCENESEAYSLERKLHKVYSFAKYKSDECFDGASELFEISVMDSSITLLREFTKSENVFQLVYRPYHKYKPKQVVSKLTSKDNIAKRDMFIFYVSHLLNRDFKLSPVNIVPDYCYKEMKLKKTGEIYKYLCLNSLHDNLLSINGKRLFGTAKGNWVSDCILQHIVANDYTTSGEGILLGCSSPTNAPRPIHSAFRRYLNVHSHEQLIQSYNITTGFCEHIS